MFNLEKSITNWRRQMIAGGIKSGDVLDELESHLREEIERRVRDGATAQQAFEDSALRIGKPEQLKIEFSKIERLRPALSPRLISTGCTAVGLFIVFTGMWLFIGAPLSEQVLGFAWLLLVGAYVALLPRINRSLWPGVRGLALRKSVVTACGFCIVASTAALLLTCIIPLKIAIVPNVIFWPLSTATVTTLFVLAYATDERLLDFWSPAAQQCLTVAHGEALRFHHDFIGTEHVLLGLLESEDGTVTQVLGRMGVQRETIRKEIEKIVAGGPQQSPRHPPVYTPRAKQAFCLALKEARSLHSARVEAPHVFLGLLREGSGVAAVVLKKLGINLDNAREEVLRKCF